VIVSCTGFQFTSIPPGTSFFSRKREVTIFTRTKVCAVDYLDNQGLQRGFCSVRRRILFHLFYNFPELNKRQQLTGQFHENRRTISFFFRVPQHRPDVIFDQVIIDVETTVGNMPEKPEI
jgi:hypothetical protein